MNKFKLTNDRVEWMDFIYDVNNVCDGYKLVTKDNIQKVLTERLIKRGNDSHIVGKWFVCDTVRNKIVHNYEK
jgi:uncharacterized protein with HEPN domain